MSTSPRIPRSSLRCTAGIILDEKATVALQGTAPEAPRTGVLTLTTKRFFVSETDWRYWRAFRFHMPISWKNFEITLEHSFEYWREHVFMHFSSFFFCFALELVKDGCLTPQIAAQVIAELQTKDPREVPNPSGPQCVHNLIFVIICILYIYIYIYMIYIYDIYIDLCDIHIYDIHDMICVYTYMIYMIWSVYIHIWYMIDLCIYIYDIW